MTGKIIDRAIKCAVRVCLLLAGGHTAAADHPPLDALVVAPHWDDEAIGCTGVILRAMAEKKRVGIAVLTAGDGFPKAAAAAAKSRSMH